MSGHTLGPCHVVENYKVDPLDPRNNDIAIVSERGRQKVALVYARVGDVRGETGETLAIAHQIAAVSDLMEALIYTLEALGNPVPISKRHIARKISAALAKARRTTDGEEG